MQGRDLLMITVTDFAKADDGKKTIWLQARQHGRGHVLVAEGAMRLAVSDTPQARALRESTVCVFTPMVAATAARSA